MTTQEAEEFLEEIKGERERSVARQMDRIQRQQYAGPKY